ncbi:phage tail protein I [Phenylobacterium sp.]|uniref:phage tail protein I n=1 Tax=Phenylobacterium sp. TaxID=1871053 RepID=UPI00272F053D|nr:phage tail protein I [Phenylobacterium sp.]MDP2214772.1 phage tail protein I [Phenylobacterium sp.]
MSDAVSLQPQNATPLMRAVSLTNADRRPIAPADLASLWDPRACPAAVLPYLAAAHGVSVWRSAWPDARKRRVIARSIALKSQRGTLPCFEEHLAFVDSEMVQVTAPPQRAVTLDPWTVQQREAWKAQFPELRVYHYRNRAQLGGLVTAGRWLTSRLTPQASQGLRYSGQQAVVVDGGVERSALVKVTSGASEFVQTAQISLPTSGRFCVPGRSGRGFFPQASIARERLFMIRSAERGPDTVRPGLQPIDVSPTRISSPIANLVAFPAGQALAGPFRFLRASRAREAVYDSIRLFEPSRVRAGKVRRRAGLTPGFSRLGQPPFHLELAIDLSHRRRKARRLPNMPGFLEEFDPTRTEEALSAIRAAKLGRDRVIVRTGLHRRIQLGDRVPLNGTFRLGQIIRSL